MSEDVIDLDDALERVENDTELLVELLEVFMEDCPKKIEALKKASENKDFSQLKDLAHSMKGASANISAQKMREIFINIEEMSKKEDVSDMGSCLKALSQQLVELKEYYDKLKKKLEG